MPANCTAHQPCTTNSLHPDASIQCRGSGISGSTSLWESYRQPCALDILLSLLHSVKGINQSKPKTPIALQSWHRARLYAIADTLHKTPAYAMPWADAKYHGSLYPPYMPGIYAVWASYLYHCCLWADMAYATSVIPVAFVIAIIYAAPETAAIPMHIYSFWNALG